MEEKLAELVWVAKVAITFFSVFFLALMMMLKWILVELKKVKS